jgi:hypothetical protein
MMYLRYIVIDEEKIYRKNIERQAPRSS